MAAPFNIGLPSISGTPQVGQTLVANDGVWGGSLPQTSSYQWLRCNSGGASCSSIVAATLNSYTLVAADIGSTIRVRVTRSNMFGNASAISNATSQISGIPPFNMVLPTISGSPVEGQTLIANDGVWGGSLPQTSSYQWLRCNSGGASCSNILGATTNSYTLAAADVGSTIRVRVTRSNSSGSGFAISNQVGPIALLCIVKDTQILMADGSFKSIQNLQRGDLVAANPEKTLMNQVARLNIQQLDPQCPITLYKFEEHSLGHNIPFKPLFITENHPIIYGQSRKPAQCFALHPQVIKCINDECHSIVKNHEGEYLLYDVQFDHDGTYVANGIVLQSRSPRSQITPLDKDLYFDHSLWTPDVVWDCFEQSLPLDLSIITEFDL